MKRIFAAVWLALVVAPCFAQVDPNRVVATVNGEEIKGDEYYRRMEHLPDVGKVLEGGRIAVYPPGFLTIVQLIDERLVLQLAKEKGVYPTDQEVLDLEKESMAADATLMQRWLNSGNTEDELKNQFRYEAAKFNLQTQGITVTDQEVADHYQKYPPKKPKMITLRLIAVQDEASEKPVDDDLAAGKSFADVAQARSIDVTQVKAGELGTIPMDALPKNVYQALDQMKIGTVSDWLDASGAKVKYLVEGKSPEETLPFDAVLKTQLRRELMLDKGAVKNNVVQEISDYRKAAKIDIKPKEFAQAYDDFVKAYLKG